jgi:alpha-beta hydrolase superfamily lysophospholipase
MHVTETLVRAADGCRLFVRLCHADGPAAGTLVVLHGACEHGERYLAFARWLTSQGWNAILPDYRGHGRSEGVRTHIGEFAEYVQDVEAVRSHFGLARERTVLFGHSTGGLVSILHAQRYPGNVAAIAMTSPLLGLTVQIPWTTYLAGRMVSFVAPRTRFRSTIEPAWSTRNIESQQLRLRDPLALRTVTAGWYFAMRRAIRQAWSEARRVTAPLLVLQAGRDLIVDPTATASWLETTGSSDRLFVMRDDDYHELLNEPNWEETAAIALSWLAPRVPARPAASPCAA